MLRGLNWGHRRAMGPMDSISLHISAEIGTELVWDQQTLGGFEHGLVASVADRYDLVVFDHPFCGSIASEGLLTPLCRHLPDLNAGQFIGKSFESYWYKNELWGLPIDGATQAGVYRPDLLCELNPPDNWGGAIEIARALRRKNLWMGIPTLAPHGILTLLALCANLGHPWPQDQSEAPVDKQKLMHAVEMLSEACSLSHPACAGMNAIDLHEAMCNSDTIAYCPVTYFYLCYALPDYKNPLRFCPFPGADGSPNGSVLGGTGLGITRSCKDVNSALKLLRYLSRRSVQVNFMLAGGQPARSEPWTGMPEDKPFASAHQILKDTMTTAWMRPRFAGYIPWQAEAGRLTERLVRQELNAKNFCDQLLASWEAIAPYKT